MIRFILSSLFILFSLPAFATPMALSFNGNISGTPSITSLVLTVYSGACNLFTTNDYGAVPLDSSGNFSVTINGASGTFLGNASGAAYTSLDNIFDTANSNIIGSGGCSVNGASASWAVSVSVNSVSLTGSVPINAVPFAVQAQSAVSVKQIGGAAVSPTAPSANQVLQYSGGFWTPVTLPAGGTVNSVTATTPLLSTGGANPVLSIGGLASLGTANQILGMNAGATGYEYKTLGAGTGLSIANAVNSVTVSPAGELAGLAAISGTGFVKHTAINTYATANALNLATDVIGTLPITNGGTNSTTALNNNRVMISSGGAIVEHTALSPNAPLRTDAAGLPTVGAVSLASEVTGVLPIIMGGTGSTTGSIAGSGALNFSAGGTNQSITLTPTGTGSIIANSKVGIGTIVPAGQLHVYQGGNTKTQLNIGVSGVGNAETMDLNFIGAGGSGNFSFNNASTKGFQFRAFGHGNASPDHLELNFWDGLTQNTIMDVNQAYMVINTPTSISSYYNNPYTTTSGTLQWPEAHTVIVGNNAGPTNIASLNVFTTGGSQSGYMGVVGTGTGNTPNIVFGSQTGANSYSEKMRIDTTGKVGIGTSSPNASLDVVGGIRGRVQYPGCASGCSNLTLTPSAANAHLVLVGSGSIAFGAANATVLSGYEGYEFSFTVCATGGSSVSVSFGGHTGGFANSVSWSPVSVSTCSSQKFVVMNNGGMYAFPVSPQVSYTP